MLRLAGSDVLILTDRVYNSVAQIFAWNVLRPQCYDDGYFVVVYFRRASVDQHSTIRLW